ncbi:MAG: CHAT domain-containing protein, partial [Blastocatellia bacterium]
MAAAFNYLCEAYVELGEYDRAIEACHQSQLLSEKSVYLPYGSITQGLLATIARKRGDLAQARTHFETAISLTENLRSKAALLAQRAALLGGKQRLFVGYIELLTELHRRQPAAGHDQMAFQISERARARSLLESLIEARADLRAGVEPALLAQEKSLQRQLEAKATEQTYLLSGKHTEAQAAKVGQELSALTTEYGQLQTEIRQKSPRYAALIQPQPLSASQIQKEVVANNDTLLLQYALGEEQSFLWAISANSFNSYELPKGEIIEKAAQRVYDLLTARNQEVRFETAEERSARIKKADAEFQIAAAELSRLILSPVATELRRKRPKQLLIVADGKLQYVPFAALPMPGMERGRERGKEGKIANRSVPPSLRPSIPLVANYEIVNLPSASTLAVLRRELKDRKPAPKTLAVFADPVFEADDMRVSKDVRDRLARERQTPAQPKEKPAESAIALDELTRAIKNVGLDGERGGLHRLPFSREEAKAILQFAPAADSFSALDFDATQDAALKPELSQYRYVHFATHGLMDNTTPDLSGLVLSQFDAEGRSLEGYLRMVEIINLNLPAELVVLSACKTGLGKEVRGEGLMSLTRGFMYAGAARVMVSLWDVNDKSTSVLMGELYRGLLQQKLRPSAALRAAQLKMLNSKQWAAPFYWAAFVQLG